MSKLLEKFDELVQEMASMHEANRLLNERLAELNKNEKFILQQQQMYIDIASRYEETISKSTKTSTNEVEQEIRAVYNHINRLDNIKELNETNKKYVKEIEKLRIENNEIKVLNSKLGLERDQLIRSKQQMMPQQKQQAVAATSSSSFRKQGDGHVKKIARNK